MTKILLEPMIGEKPMKLKNKIIHFLIAILLFITMLPVSPVSAASASISISMVSEQALEGSNCTIAVLVSANTTLDSVKLSLSYDSEYLQLLSENPLYEAIDSHVVIDDPNLKEKAVNQRKYILEFQALKKGNTGILIEGVPEIIESTNKTKLSIAKKEFSLTIHDKDKLSDNNKLSSLSVKEGKLTSKFDPQKTVYELNVAYDKSKVTITAKPEDSNASVTVVGNEQLQIGANKVAVLVTSESGIEREYTIYVNREPMEGGVVTEEPVPSPSSEPSEPPLFTEEPTQLDSYVIKKENGLVYYNGSSEYVILVPYDDSNVPKGYERISLVIQGVELTAYALDGNVYQEFILFYAKQEGEDPGWYQFDQLQGTIQRLNDTGLIREEENKPSDTSLLEKNYQDRIDLLGLVMGIEACLIILLLILVIRGYMKQKGYHDELE